MRDKAVHTAILMLSVLSLAVFPWLAWQESQRQAFDSVAEMTRAYANAVLYRANKTALQSQDAIAALAPLARTPCSRDALAQMRRLDLTSTYLQAVGAVDGDTMVCSSIGTDPIDLGRESLRTSTGVRIFRDVPMEHNAHSPLMALVRGPFAVLVHRDLPLDIATSLPDVALGVLHMESSPGAIPLLAKGVVQRRWLARLGTGHEVAFVDGDRLVAVVRSRTFLIVAVAAVPIEVLAVRSRAIAQRLVPVGALAGLAVAVALVSLARQQRSIASALRYGLRHHEFYLAYQPIVDLASGHCGGVEALLRWRRSTGEQIGPDLFIPVAEQTGIVSRLTARVFDLVAADMGTYLAAHPDFHVAINLAPADLHSDAIVALVDAFLARTGATPGNLLLEMTERGLLDRGAASGVLAALRARGIAVAIDDFGTGYSSLSYLESLDVDWLKIDRSFIEAIGTKAPTSQVVGHIIAMARAMHLGMIAEGIETAAQAAYLTGCGVHYGQGWLYGKPAPFGDVLRRWEAGLTDAVDL